MIRNNSSRSHKVVRNARVKTQNSRRYFGSLPKCNDCNRHHFGVCFQCTRCNQLGRTARYCMKDDRKKCFECGNLYHFRDRCPRLNRGSIGTSKRNKKKRVTREYQGCKAQEGAFVIGTEEARQDPHKLTGTFPLNDHYALVISDSGADRSFISLRFRPLIHLTSKKVDRVYSIELADGRELEAEDVIPDCTLSLAGELFSIDLGRKSVGLCQRGNFELVNSASQNMKIEMHISMLNGIDPCAEPCDDSSGFIPRKPKSVISKPENSTETHALGPEKNKPEGAKGAGTDKEKSVKPHTPRGLRTQNSKSKDVCASVKPIKGLDSNSSTFEVGENSRAKPNQPLTSSKPNFSKPSSEKDGRRKDGGKNVKPPSSDHQRKNNRFTTFPKRHGPSHAGVQAMPHLFPAPKEKSKKGTTPKASVASNPKVSHVWYIDYGAYRHMTSHRPFLFDYVEKFEGYIKTTDKTPKKIMGYGNITDGKYIIKNVQYVEGLGYNMFSSSHFCDSGIGLNNSCTGAL
ncbi:hypothetical protein OSB04_029068 [Centaurea solstitialis]|uniref:Retrovirus-related Pol polyprotein from transposon TNT 1-94-like beta-barrel domain-containing protein n=1 Tax=Centaurea solstitialis TaxID=347529 RepID=A0AA38T0J0_9ASTR|nr:hypothetical protein OSB04_029068 [Centaurea solstitialis]